MWKRSKTWAKILKRDIKALYLATKDARVPWHARALAVIVAAYALSPIDLIPDFIPVIGYLDDLIILPLGISLAIRMIPDDVMDDLRKQADEVFIKRSRSNLGAAFVMCVWILLIALVAWLILGEKLANAL